jgi:uncharacterized paraquat-inducible protein A
MQLATMPFLMSNPAENQRIEREGCPRCSLKLSDGQDWLIIRRKQLDGEPNPNCAGCRELMEQKKRAPRLTSATIVILCLLSFLMGMAVHSSYQCLARMFYPHP